MIALQKLQLLAQSFPAIGTLTKTNLEILARQLAPSDAVVAAEVVQVKGQMGVLVATASRLIAVYSTKVLLKNFPTYQEIHFEQVHVLEPAGARAVSIRAAVNADGSGKYEENTFTFASSSVAQGFAHFVRTRSPRLAGS